jgi:G3E family GTPase
MAMRVVLLGGYLGAGKSTLAISAVKHLAARGMRPAIVTNDQSDGLVDTALVDRNGIDVCEVTNGCFCCRFPDLLGALETMSRDSNADVVVAEAVGSCTDLMSTVLRPLRQYHADQFALAPLTIVVDPFRMMGPMSEVVKYLYRQQVLEAEIIAVNKCDALPAEQLEPLVEKLKSAAPGAKVVCISAQTGDGVPEWLDLVSAGTSQLSRTLDLDYTRYAQAEAHLGWLNASGTLKSGTAFSPDRWATSLLRALSGEFSDAKAEIAHVKLLVHSGMRATKASMTGDDGSISWDMRGGDGVTNAAAFLLNARVGTDPDSLAARVRQALEASLEGSTIRYAVDEWTCFSPPEPKPTYRM